MNYQFDKKSIEFQKNVSKDERFSLGIFFTPKYIRDFIFKTLKELKTSSPTTILEPTCGSGEFLVDCEKLYPNASIIGVEIDSRSADIANSLTFKSKIIEHDFMEWSSDQKFDLIIGNPPFVVRPPGFKHDPSIVTCRSNLCVEVVYKCITRHLSSRGVLAMVLPVSILKSSFYKPTLDLIINTTAIEAMKTFANSKFLGTNVSVIVLILRLKDVKCDSKANPYIFKSDDMVVINQHAEELMKISKGKKLLKSFDVKISFGVSSHNIKEFLINTRTDNSFPLITHKYITKKNHETQYVCNTCPKKRWQGRGLFIARGYGHGDYVFRFIDEKFDEYMIENHVIAITGPDDILDIISKSFQDPRTREFCKLLCTSGDISKTYVNHIPIFEYQT